ncbi:MAG: site-specific integrase [Rhodospirillaceae bacterium]
MGSEIEIVSTGGAVSTEVADLIADARDYAAASKAPNTVRAYRSSWRDFDAWTTEHDLDALPASPATVVLYLTDRANAGIKVSTLRIALAAIGAAHQAAGLEFNAKQRDLVAVWSGIRRKLGVRTERKAPVLKDDLADMLDKLDRTTLAGKRDAALLLVGFGAALRRSELVALDVADMSISREGVKVVVKRSKTDQEGAGTEIGIASGRAAAAVQEWISAAGLTTGPLFRMVRKGGHLTADRLTDKSVADIVKRLAGAAGLDAARYSGHSLRAGLATSAALAGAGLTSIMKQTRHKSVDVAKTYIRDADLWRDNVSALVL